MAAYIWRIICSSPEASVGFSPGPSWSLKSAVIFVRMTSGLRLLTKSSKCDRTLAFISSVVRLLGIGPSVVW
jgi:hypothetical protein